MKKLTVYNSNLVTFGNTYVGRIDHSSYLTSQGARGVTTFFTASGDHITTGYDTPHKISAPLYVGGPADWQIKPDFVIEVEAILNA